jgi:hypothetical protein
MYANLKVRQDGDTALASRRGQSRTEVFAHEVKVEAVTGKITVYLDDPNGPDEKYANPAGEIQLHPDDGAIRITASF